MLSFRWNALFTAPKDTSVPEMNLVNRYNLPM